jgi:predicted nucleic acid-binding protein
MSLRLSRESRLRQNVLYSAFVAKGFCEEVVDEAAGACSIIWSRALEKEFDSVLTRRHKPGPATRAAVEAFAELCQFVEPEPLPKRVCRDKDDDVVLATALTGNGSPDRDGR